MEAKDTVMNEETLIAMGYNIPEALEDAKDVAQAQAEISFKAGIREVVEWLNSNTALEQCDPDVMPYFEDYHWIPKHIWQAKLNEWNIREGK